MQRNLKSRIPKFNTLPPSWRQPVENLVVSMSTHISRESESYKSILLAAEVLRNNQPEEALRILEQREQLTDEYLSDIQGSLQYLADSEDRFIEVAPSEIAAGIKTH